MESLALYQHLLFFCNEIFNILVYSMLRNIYYSIKFMLCTVRITLTILFSITLMIISTPIPHPPPVPWMSQEVHLPLKKNKQVSPHQGPELDIVGYTYQESSHVLSNYCTNFQFLNINNLSQNITYKPYHYSIQSNCTTSNYHMTEPMDCSILDISDDSSSGDQKSSPDIFASLSKSKVTITSPLIVVQFKHTS